MPPTIPSEEEVIGYFESCSNWGRWGADDERGAINHITPETRRRAAALVREGITVSCGRPLSKVMEPDVTNPLVHFMTGTGEPWAAGNGESGVMQMSSDFIGIAFHGLTVTHVDSLAHFFWNGRMYNGLSSDAVTTREGATKQSIDVLKDGVVSRGVLMDIPRLRGVDWLEPGSFVFPEDLEAAERAQGVEVGPGDILLTRVGCLRQRNEQGPTAGHFQARAGLHAACLPWLHDRGVAMLGSDSAQDAYPGGYERVPMPIHQMGIVAIGLWLIDNCDLEALSETCARLGRYEFMMSVSTLRVPNGTGSPVNPTAVF